MSGPLGLTSRCLPPQHTDTTTPPADARTAVSAAVDSEETKEDRLHLLARIAEAVAEDDMEQLKRGVEAYK